MPTKIKKTNTPGTYRKTATPRITGNKTATPRSGSAGGSMSKISKPRTTSTQKSVTPMRTGVTKARIKQY